MSFKISTVIPVYNAEKTLENALESILNQNWDGNFSDDIEIILVNDNSSDSSLDIIKDYASKYENIVYFSFDNNSGFGGRGRNKGIDLASGDYIILMDNDDIYLPNAFKTLYEAISCDDADVVSANYKDDILAERRVHCPKKYNRNMMLNPSENQHRFDIISTAASRAPWAKIYKKEFLIKNNIRFLEDSQFDDAEFYINCLLNAKKFKIIPFDYVYVYYTYATSQVRIHDKKHFDARLDAIKQIDKLIKEKGLKSDRFVSYCLMDSLLILCNSNESKKNKYQMIEDLYEFEKTFDKIEFNKVELDLLNNQIKNKKFTRAFILSKGYKFFYNNKIIRKTYRKYNNRQFSNQK